MSLDPHDRFYKGSCRPILAFTFGRHRACCTQQVRVHATPTRGKWKCWLEIFAYYLDFALGAQQLILLSVSWSELRLPQVRCFSSIFSCFSIFLDNLTTFFSTCILPIVPWWQRDCGFVVNLTIFSLSNSLSHLSDIRTSPGDYDFSCQFGYTFFTLFFGCADLRRPRDDFLCFVWILSVSMCNFFQSVRLAAVTSRLQFCLSIWLYLISNHSFLVFRSTATASRLPIWFYLTNCHISSYRFL